MFPTHFGDELTKVYLADLKSVSVYLMVASSYLYSSDVSSFHQVRLLEEADSSSFCITAIQHGSLASVLRWLRSARVSLPTLLFPPSGVPELSTWPKFRLSHTSVHADLAVVSQNYCRSRTAMMPPLASTPKVLSRHHPSPSFLRITQQQHRHRKVEALQSIHHTLILTNVGHIFADGAFAVAVNYIHVPSNDGLLGSNRVHDA